MHTEINDPKQFAKIYHSKKSHFPCKMFFGKIKNPKEAISKFQVVKEFDVNAFITHRQRNPKFITFVIEFSGKNAGVDAIRLKNDGKTLLTHHLTTRVAWTEEESLSLSFKVEINS